MSRRRSPARVLDHFDRRVSHAISLKRKLIALLAEQRGTIAEAAALHGIGEGTQFEQRTEVPWVGTMPKPWSVKRAKWYFREVDKRSSTGEEELLSVSHLTGITPRSEKNITMFMARTYEGHKLCEPGDIVINTMWAWMGAPGVARQTGLVSPAYGVYRPISDGNFDPEYIDALLRTSVYIGEYVRRSTGIRASRLRLYPDKFLSIPLICPPLAEQKAIAAYIRSATADIARALCLAQQEIALLREYRNRLIADVVTGRVDVRAAAADLSDEIDPVAEPLDELDDLDYDDGAVEDVDLEFEASET